MSMQINREDKEINFAELLAQRCAASAEEAITLGTSVSLGIREYKDKKGFVPKEKERLQGLLERSQMAHTRLDNEINTLVDSGFDMAKLPQAARNNGFADATNPADAALDSIATRENADNALFQQAVLAHDDFEKFYNEQPHMRRMELWNGAPPEDMKEAIRKTFGQIATAESPIQPLGLDAPLYRQEIDAEYSEARTMEGNKALYSNDVRDYYLEYLRTEQPPEGREWVAGITKENREEVFAFAEKVSGKDDKNGLMAQFVNSTPEDRLVMHRENETEEEKKGEEELKGILLELGTTEDMAAPLLDEYARADGKKRAITLMGMKLALKQKQKEDTAKELAASE